MSLVNLGFRERNGLIKISKKKYELVFKFKMCISSKKKKNQNVYKRFRESTQYTCIRTT